METYIKGKNSNNWQIGISGGLDKSKDVAKIDFKAYNQEKKEKHCIKVKVKIKNPPPGGGGD